MASKKVDDDASSVSSVEADDAVNDISLDSVSNKYGQAADVANRAIKTVTAAAVAGARVVELCSLGDKFIDDECAKLQTKLKGADAKLHKSMLTKGVAFPTCVNRNNCAGNFSPFSTDTTVLVAGDLVHIDLGVHIHGYCAFVAQTIVVPAAAGEPAPLPTDKRADVIAAAQVAADCVLHMLTPGKTTTEVTELLAHVAHVYGVRAVEGVMSHQILNYTWDAEKTIMNRAPLPSESKAQEHKFAAGEAYQIDIVFSTGDGKPKAREERTTVFKPDVADKPTLRLDAARWLFTQISKNRAPSLPFTLRAFNDELKAKMGLTELVNQGKIHGLPVLFEANGEFVAHVKFTALITATNTLRITSPTFLPVVSTKENDKKIKEVLSLPLKRGGAKKTKKKGKKGGAAAAPAAAAAAAAAPAATPAADAPTPMETNKSQ